MRTLSMKDGGCDTSKYRTLYNDCPRNAVTVDFEVSDCTNLPV
jgi:hypothetical protein